MRACITRMATQFQTGEMTAARSFAIQQTHTHTHISHRLLSIAMPPTTNRAAQTQAYAAKCVLDGLCPPGSVQRLAAVFQRVLSLKDLVPWKGKNSPFIVRIENLKWYLPQKRERNETAKMLSAVSSICTSISFCAALLTRPPLSFFSCSTGPNPA